MVPMRGVVEGEVVKRTVSRQDDRIPMPVLLVGSAGIFPLLFGLTLAALSPKAFGLPIVRIAIVYGAMILSFLGGMYWGIATPQLTLDTGSPAPPRILGWSIVPSLVSLVVVYLPSPIASSVLAAAFVAVLRLDRACFRLGYVPRWWMLMRFWLTALVVPLLMALAVLDD